MYLHILPAVFLFLQHLQRHQRRWRNKFSLLQYDRNQTYQNKYITDALHPALTTASNITINIFLTDKTAGY